MSTQEPLQSSSDTGTFDFGKGATALDEYVASIAADRHGSDYARQVGTEREWSIDYACYLSFERSGDQLVMNESAPLPRWLFNAVQGHAYPDTDTPAPSCFMSASATIDWFALAHEHSTELVISPPCSPAPTVSQIESALKVARAHSAKANLWVTCFPPVEAGGAFRLRPDSLFVTPLPGDADVESLIQTELGGANPFIVPSKPKILDWSWMSCGPEIDHR